MRLGHLWLGLPAAAVFVVVALTGALLVFERDLDRAFHPELWRVDTTATAQPLDALLVRAQAVAPDFELKEVRLTAGTAQPVEFRFDRGPHVRLDPGTGTLLGTRARGDSFFGLVERIHTSLVLGKVGKWIVAASSLVLVALLGTGIVLWWPKQWRMVKGAVSLALNRMGRAFHFNLHNTLGFWAALPLLAIAVTGAIMGIKPLGDALRGHSGKDFPPAATSSEISNSTSQIPTVPASLDALRAAAAGVFPDWRELRLHAPRGRSSVWRAEAVLAASAHEHARPIAWLDPRTAAVLRLDPFSSLPLGQRLRALARPMHDGSMFGRPTQFVAFLAVLVVPVLSVTGVALWWLRRRAENAQRKCTALGVRRSLPFPAASLPSPSLMMKTAAQIPTVSSPAPSHSNVAALAALAFALCMAGFAPAATPPATPAAPPPVRLDPFRVEAEAESDHFVQGPFLPDVQGARINAGKKTTILDFDSLPRITGNNYRQALAQAPGLVLSEETSPLLSIGYRGLEPHRAQFTQVLTDGVPIHADQFGYPEAYYTPPLDTVDRIEFVRGGAALMFGPQPGGALNYVTHRPRTDRPFSTATLHTLGSEDYYSTFSYVDGTVGRIGYYGYFNHRQSDGIRSANNDYSLGAWLGRVVLDASAASRWMLTLETYEEEHGEPGGLTFATGANAANYLADRRAASRLNDRFNLDRRAASLVWERDFARGTFAWRTWAIDYA
ncbi:MAG: PepSY domain-containing protein, partial [Verrucomicrobia bacterium]|nr:PepSY domain-containing protein [Verrucomicrobiota bacterium]